MKPEIQVDVAEQVRETTGEFEQARGRLRVVVVVILALVVAAVIFAF